MAEGPVDLLRRVPLFSELDKDDVERMAKSFRERTFSSGQDIASEGQRGIGFFLIESGSAKVTKDGDHLATLGPGDYFGEIALIDDGPRTATVTADGDLKCWGLTSWEFKPIVETNAQIGWKLLQTLAKRLREAEKRSG